MRDKYVEAEDLCRQMKSSFVIGLVQIMDPNLEAISDGGIVLIGLVHRFLAWCTDSWPDYRGVHCRL